MSLDDLILSNSESLRFISTPLLTLYLPLIYRSEYNIRFWGLEHLHPFDTNKWGRVNSALIESLVKKWNLANKNLIRLIEPNHSITDHELALVHDDKFIHDVNHKKSMIVSTSEVCLLYLIPMRLLQRHLIRPLRYQTTDPMAYTLIVDCDAHQGNGYARDVLLMNKEEKKHIYILDLYNARIYPRDEAAKTIIDREVILPYQVEDEEYLELLKYHLNASFELDKFKPNFIGIIKRDEMVFMFAQHYNIPILMLLSGGYQRSNAQIIADSILNLFEVNLLKPINNIN
ncbi:Histone deacetylase 11 [Blomia tropicalis]|nr:Histone deacetylase 11 [Blomia tropicalis]